MLFVLSSVGLVLVALAVLGLLWYYPNKNTTLLVKLVVGLAWFASLSVLVLVPADLLATLASEEKALSETKPVLKAWWSVAYWYAFVCMILLLPLLQRYADSGDFHPWGRFCYAVTNSLQFLVGVAVLGAIGALLWVWWKQVSFGAIIGWGMALSNAYGLVGSIFLMGYGLVDIPRKLWQMADIRRRELIMFHRAGTQVERTGKAHYELSYSIALVNRVSALFGRRDQLRPFMDRILSMIDRVGDFEPAEVDLDNDDVDLDYFTRQDLGTLRRRLRQGIEGYQRDREIYLEIVRSYLGVHDILKNMDRAGLPFTSPTNTNMPKWVRDLEWWWKCRLQPVAMRLAAVLLGLLSLAVVVAQVTISKKLPNLSVFSYLIHNVNSSWEIFLLCFAVFLYPALAAYYTLFKLGRFNFYLLTAGHTAPYSLVSNALFMCKFAFPLAFNFLVALAAPIGKNPQPDAEQTIFYQDLGHPMAEQPVFGTSFTTYVPIILLPYMVLVIFNVFNRLAGFFDRSQKLSFDEDWDVTSTYASTGQTMLRIEVENRDAELELGSTISQGHVRITGGAPNGIVKDTSLHSIDNPKRQKKTRKVSYGTDSKYQSNLEKGIGFSEPRSQRSDGGNSSRLDNIFTDITRTPSDSAATAPERHALIHNRETEGKQGTKNWFGKGHR